MLEDDELDVKPFTQKRAKAPTQCSANAMSSENYDLIVTESDVSGQGSGQRNAPFEEADLKTHRHAVCSNPTEADPLLEREGVVVSWILYLVLAALTGLSAFGLVSGFALVEARFLFLAILGLSTLWLLASWGEQPGSGEREV